MKLKGLARARIFVRSDNQVPAARPSDTMLLGTGTRLVPTVYEGFRVQRRRRRVAMALAIVVPTLLATLYYAFVASDRYVSEAKMVVKEQSGGSNLSGLAGGGKSSLLSLVGMGGGGAGATDEAAIVTNYLLSPEAMKSLDAAIGLRRMWSGATIDLLSRLREGASEEDFYRYFKRRVTVVADPLDPVIELQVEAFRRDDAQVIAKKLVALAQEKLNTAFVRMREDALQFARSEVKQAEQQMAGVEAKLRDFRNAHGEIDPAASAQAVGTVASGLFGQLALTEAELRTTLSYAREDSPTVKALKARIDALKQQIAADRSLLAGNPSDKPYAELLGAYQDLLLDEKFAQDAYTSAMAFLTSSRAELERQHAYLVDFISPSLPQEATEPRAARNVLVVLLGSALVWLIGTLVTSSIREHARQ
jgi:capsular polysaccharide transport system permease protein